VHGTNNLFVLAVPKLQLFDVWLKPEMKVVVEPPSEANRCVRLVALECTVTGSPFIENLGFNELFVVSMETQLEHMQSDRQLQARAQVCLSSPTTNSCPALLVLLRLSIPTTLLPKIALQRQSLAPASSPEHVVRGGTPKNPGKHFVHDTSRLKPAHLAALTREC
jgi:hypothetical protein